MEVNKVTSNKWKCRKHPTVLCDFICLEEDAKDRVVCFQCVQKRLIPVSKVIQMSSVLAAKNCQILQFYPPLDNQDLSEKLKDLSSPQSIEEIDLFFKKLREDLEKEVLAAQQKAKKFFIKQQEARQSLLDEYMRIAEIEKLKELILSEKEGTDTELDNFIKDKWNKAEINQQILQELIEQYEAGQFISTKKPKLIAQKMIQSLRTIDFFGDQFSPKVNFIKSTFGSSQMMKIKQIDLSTYQIKNRSPDYCNQVFLDPIINPKQKYIFHIELEQKKQIYSNHFMFGLVKDERKDDDSATTSFMYYDDLLNIGGITKYIKGDPMQSGDQNTGKRSFEVRVHLDQKLLRVASLHDYSSIAEMDNPSKIKPNQDYRFFISMCSQGDVIRIKKMEIVSNFDDKM